MYKYTHFIRENTAPKGAKKIGIYDDKGNKSFHISLGNLTPVEKNKLYSFCALSDIHIAYETANEDFQRALHYVNDSDCEFTCICGDLSNDGSDSQLSTYRNVVNIYAGEKPVYAIAGNHEAGETFVEYERMIPYTGYPLYYSFTRGEDVFIMLGTYRWVTSSASPENMPLSVEELQWLYETLEENRNNRCFVFQHIFPWGGSGNALGVYPHDIWSGKIGTVFENLMKHYKNIVLFHGHSHLRFYLQELDKTANYTVANGYRSIHIPSLSVPRDMDGLSYTNIYAESEGYLVDVYDDCIVLNGCDFIDHATDGHWLPIATYKIETKLQTIPANTFTDHSGIIQTKIV